MEQELGSPLDWAGHYYHQGLCVLPARGKSPVVDWTEFQQQRPTWEQTRAWFENKSFRHISLFTICGQVSGVVVLDCDSEAAEAFWRDLLGDELLDSTACLLSGSNKGFHHYWFRLDPERDQESRAAHHGDMHWDLRGERGGVILPPSRHADTGMAYRWVRDLDCIQDWPYPEIPGKGNQSFEGGEQSSSSLAWLLQNPGAGGRNNWVTSVLGHYAKRLDFEDGYIATAEMVWDLASSIPHEHEYERDEFEKTRRSVWESENRKVVAQGGRLPEADEGYLISVGPSLQAKAYNKDQGEHLGEYAGFGLVAKELILHPNEMQSYVVEIMTPDGEVRETTLPGEVLGSRDRLSKWFLGRGLTFSAAVKGDCGVTISRADRLTRMLLSQRPRVVRSAPYMGWWRDEMLGGVYITPHGAIDKDGLHADYPIRPDIPPADLRHWEYGFHGTREEAQAVLREVMSFHDPVVTSVFASVWALTPVKGVIVRVMSLFPIVAIIAASESGKTNGFFNLMMQANGRRQTGGTYTQAGLRDEMSRHRSGFVWIDDPSNTDDLGELLRGASSESQRTRKGGANWTETLHTPLVSPIVLAAEGLEMMAERAMTDRTISIDAPSPVERMSTHDSSKRQWDDISRLMHTGPLSRYAGWYVQMAFEWLDSIGGEDGLAERILSMNTGSGRQSEKLSIVRMGVECLAYMLGDFEPFHVEGYGVAGDTELPDLRELVEAWTLGVQADEVRGPYLYNVVVPAYIRHRGFIPTPHSAPAVPVYWHHDHFRVHVASLASWWGEYSRFQTNKARAAQLGSATALKMEADAAGLPTIPVRGKRYRILPGPESRRILQVVEMEIVEDVDRDGAPDEPTLPGLTES